MLERCVIDSEGLYITSVPINIQEVNGALRETTYAYDMRPGDTLLDVPPPSDTAIPQRWNGVGWEVDGDWEVPLEMVEQLRTNKLQMVNSDTQKAIHAGIDVETSKGQEHFSLTGEDQTNIQNLTLQIQAGQSNALYHADGELCRPFSANEVMALATAATAHKTFHLTYYNHLRQYIKGIEDYDELAAVQYGMELPPELAASMAALLGV